LSQQALNLRKSLRIVQRHLKLFGAFVVLGLIIGVAYAVMEPPVLESTALVVLPQLASQADAQAASGVESDLIATQAVIAGSDPVLSAALSHVSPAMSLQSLRDKIQVSSLTGSVISISASGSTPAQAEATANAVANSYIAYVTGPTSAVGNVEAKVLESAATATGTTFAERIAIDGLMGALAGVLVGFVVSLGVGRNGRQLKERDRIANSIGVPVLGSIPVAHPSNPAGWIRLLEEYEPGPVYAQPLEAMLSQLGLTDTARGAGATSSLTILSLSSDAAALAVGPQLASFAASRGIPTALIVGPQQVAMAAVALRKAGAATSIPERRKLLRVVVSDDGDNRIRSAARLAVVVAVVDPRVPRMPEAANTAATVLAVSAGVATAGQLTRAVSVAAVGGGEVLGILVADPLPDDQSTGRDPRLGQPMRHPLPTRA
jgi:capsular polysaccharide biosynthesis protein